MADITASSISFSIVTRLKRSISITGDTWELEVDIAQLTMNCPSCLSKVLAVNCRVLAKMIFWSISKVAYPIAVLLVLWDWKVKSVVVLLNCTVEEVVLNVWNNTLAVFPDAAFAEESNLAKLAEPPVPLNSHRLTLIIKNSSFFASHAPAFWGRKNEPTNGCLEIFLVVPVALSPWDAV